MNLRPNPGIPSNSRSSCRSTKARQLVADKPELLSGLTRVRLVGLHARHKVCYASYMQ